MNTFTHFWRRLSAALRRKTVKQDIDEELRLHLELRTAENMAQGMSPAEAAQTARKSFGNVQSIREECRETRGANFGETVWQDVLFGWRMLRKNPAFTLIAVLTLALGIGVNTSMFSGFQALLLPQLPYPEADRLVRVFRTSTHSQRWSHSPANFLDQQAQNTVFQSMAAVSGRTFNLSGTDQAPERLRAMEVTGDFVGMLGIQPYLGRAFLAEEDQPGRNNVVLLNHAFWLRRFGADPNILGKTLRLDGESVTVIGVMPPAFQDRQQWGSVDLFKPMAFASDQRQNRGGNYLDVFARLKPGLSLAQAQAGLAPLAARLREQYPDNNADLGLRLLPLASSRMDPRGQIMLWMIMGLAGFVLLIACANLANLQFARTALRTRELAIRSAIGAPRGRLLRQLLTESLLIAALGGVLGLVLASWGNKILSQQLVENGQPVLNLKLNFLILGFTLAVSTITGIAFGLVPAWLASRVDLNSALKQGARGTTGDRSQHRLRHGLIVLQVALALMLLTSAGLVINGLRHFGVRDPGWKYDRLNLGYLNLPDNKYGDTVRRQAFIKQVTEKLAALPGVEKVAFARSLPLSGFRASTELGVEGFPDPAPGHRNMRAISQVGPGYFAALGMRFVEGRDFTLDDTADSAAKIIINESLARAYWPNETAIGKRIGFPDAWNEIVGVVNDVRSPSNPSESGLRFQSYHPLTQQSQANLVVAVRGNIAADTMRKMVAEVDPDLPLSEAGTVRAIVGENLSQMAVGGWLLGGFAGLGLLLAALGIYGVIAGFVAQRTNEIGVRMALGAQVRDVLGLVLGKGLRLALAGTVLGLGGAWAMARVLAAMTPEMETNAPFVVAIVAVLLMVVAFIACWLPARRATLVDPMVALRSE